jgi:nucleotidyltransferase AbiEii toxin of type IV toxin-antitoxin system
VRSFSRWRATAAWTSSSSLADGSWSASYTALARSAQKDNFVLKGAMLFLAWEGRLHRPTKDLDLLGFGSSDVLDVTDRIREVCAVLADDGIVFDLVGVQGERIKEDAESEGVRVRVPASLDGARVSMQIDVGFGDLVDPPPAELTFPVLLPLDAPVLRAYPPEAVIAEKFQAMVVLGIANSRMKDFFDIWTLAQTHRFDLDLLAGSIRGTFERRRTSLPDRVPMALTSEFLEDHSKQTQWAAFGRRLGLRDLPPLTLVGEQIAGFLVPVLSAAREATSASRTWPPSGPWVLTSHIMTD